MRASRVLNGRASRKLKLRLTSDQVSTTCRFRIKRSSKERIEFVLSSKVGGKLPPVLVLSKAVNTGWF